MKYFFADAKCKVLGLSKFLSICRFYACREPRMDRRGYSQEPPIPEVALHLTPKFQSFRRHLTQTPLNHPLPE